MKTWEGHMRRAGLRVDYDEGRISTPYGQTIKMKMIDSVWTEDTVHEVSWSPFSTGCRQVFHTIRHKKGRSLWQSNKGRNTSSYWNSPIYLHGPRHLQVRSASAEKGKGRQIWESKQSSGSKRKGIAYSRDIGLSPKREGNVYFCDIGWLSTMSRNTKKRRRQNKNTFESDFWEQENQKRWRKWDFHRHMVRRIWSGGT